MGGRSGRGAVEDCARIATFLYRNLDRITAGRGDPRHPHGRADLPPVFWVGRARRAPRAAHRDHASPTSRAAAGGSTPGSRPSFAPHGASTSRPGRSTTPGASPRAASTRSSCGPTTRWWAASATRSSRPSRRPSSSTRSRASRRRASRSRAGTPSPRTTRCSRPEVDGGRVGRARRGARTAPSSSTCSRFDTVIVAGEAKSHCVAWTVEDLLAEIRGAGPASRPPGRPARRLHVAVCVPGVVDFTDAAEAAYARFAAAGMRSPPRAGPGKSSPLPDPAHGGLLPPRRPARHGQVMAASLAILPRHGLNARSKPPAPGFHRP